MIKYDENFDEWERALLKRWKQFAISTTVTFKKTKYTMNDARKKRESMKYVLEIIRAAKTIEMSIFFQIIMIYIGLNLKFQRDMTKPTKITIMNNCVQKLKNNKKLWWNMTTFKYRSSHTSNQKQNIDNNNFRFAEISDSYNNFIFSEKSDDYNYTDSTTNEIVVEYNNQFRSTQYFIFYQFQNRVYFSQSQQRFFFRKISKQIFVSARSNWSKSIIRKSISFSAVAAARRY